MDDHFTEELNTLNVCLNNEERSKITNTFYLVVGRVATMLARKKKPGGCRTLLSSC